MQADSAQQQGLYRPEFDHDACGIGALADINGERHHQILDDALSILVNLEHRGGTGLEKNTGDGAGITWDATGAVSKSPKGMVIQDGAYVGMD